MTETSQMTPYIFLWLEMTYEAALAAREIETASIGIFSTILETDAAIKEEKRWEWFLNRPATMSEFCNIK